MHSVSIPLELWEACGPDEEFSASGELKKLSRARAKVAPPTKPQDNSESIDELLGIEELLVHYRLACSWLFVVPAVALPGAPMSWVPNKDACAYRPGEKLV